MKTRSTVALPPLGDRGAVVDVPGHPRPGVTARGAGHDAPAGALGRPPPRRQRPAVVAEGVDEVQLGAAGRGPRRARRPRSPRRPRARRRAGARPPSRAGRPRRRSECIVRGGISPAPTKTERSRTSSRRRSGARRRMALGSAISAAGSIRPRTSPRASASPPAPRRTTSSPSSRKLRVDPSASSIGSAPFHDSSSSEPRCSRCGPRDRARGEEVADAQRRAVDRHVRELLGGGPVQVARVGARDDGAVELDLEVEVERPRLLAQIGAAAPAPAPAPRRGDRGSPPAA